MKKRYGTCEARMQDEFPGLQYPDGTLVYGTIAQLEELHRHDANVVVGWFDDPMLAERVAMLLNKAAE